VLEGAAMENSICKSFKFSVSSAECAAGEGEVLAGTSCAPEGFNSVKCSMNMSKSIEGLGLQGI